MLNEVDNIRRYPVNGERPVFIVELLSANPTFATNAEFHFIDLQHHIPFR